MEQIDKREYELAFLAKTEEDAKGVLDALRGFQAEISFEGPVSRTTLAYRIKNEEVALFGYCNFSLLPEKIKELSGELRVKPGIIRFLVITPPFSKQKPRLREMPTAAMQGDQRPVRSSKPHETKPTSLSNEALEKKIEEILQ